MVYILNGEMKEEGEKKKEKQAQKFGYWYFYLRESLLAREWLNQSCIVSNISLLTLRNQLTLQKQGFCIVFFI